VKASNGDAAIEVEVGGKPKQFSPPEISAMILSKLKADAETRLAKKLRRPSSRCRHILTTPSGRPPRTRARSPSGSPPHYNEPTAASLAYGLDKKKDEKIAVYD